MDTNMSIDAKVTRRLGRRQLETLAALRVAGSKYVRRSLYDGSQWTVSAETLRTLDRLVALGLASVEHHGDGSRTYRPVTP